MSGWARWVPLIAISFGMIAAAPGPRRISVDVIDAKTSDVLRLLAERRGLNLVMRDELGGRISVHLKRVTAREAFDAVLRLKGLGVEREGRILFVDEMSSIVARHRAHSEARRIERETGELVTVIVPLNYARAAELRPLVASMLSPRGSVQVYEPTNSLIITDVVASVARVRRLGR